jgi:hypothetical protein
MIAIEKALRDRTSCVVRLKVVREMELMQWEGKKAGHLFRDLLPAWLAMLCTRGLKLSRSTAYNWRRRYRARGVAGLVDGRRIRPVNPAATLLRRRIVRQMEQMRDNALTHKPRRLFPDVHAACLARHGLKVSQGTVYRWLKRYSSKLAA